MARTICGRSGEVNEMTAAPYDWRSAYSSGGRTSPGSARAACASASRSTTGIPPLVSAAGLAVGLGKASGAVDGIIDGGGGGDAVGLATDEPARVVGSTCGGVATGSAWTLQALTSTTIAMARDAAATFSRPALNMGPSRREIGSR